MVRWSEMASWLPGFVLIQGAWSGSPGCGAARPQGGDIPGERGSEGFRPELPVLGFLSPGAGRGREVLAGWCRDLNCPVSAQVGSRGPSSGASRSHLSPGGQQRSLLWGIEVSAYPALGPCSESPDPERCPGAGLPSLPSVLALALGSGFLLRRSRWLSHIHPKKAASLP